LEELLFQVLYAQTATEEYNGSTWGPGGNLGTARYFLSGCGTQTAALAFGGVNATPTITNVTEEYNGSAWTAGGNLGTATAQTGAACGTQTAGLAFGGNPPSSPPATAATEEYNGSLGRLEDH
jgi:hypothetical protein